MDNQHLSHSRLSVKNTRAQRTQSMPVNNYIPQSPNIMPTQSLSDPPFLSLPAASPFIGFDHFSAPNQEHPNSLFYSCSCPPVRNMPMNEDIEIERQLEEVNLAGSVPRNSIYGQLVGNRLPNDQSDIPLDDGRITPVVNHEIQDDDDLPFLFTLNA